MIAIFIPPLVTQRRRRRRRDPGGATDRRRRHAAAGRVHGRPRTPSAPSWPPTAPSRSTARRRRPSAPSGTSPRYAAWRARARRAAGLRRPRRRRGRRHPRASAGRGRGGWLSPADVERGARRLRRPADRVAHARQRDRGRAAGGRARRAGRDQGVAPGLVHKADAGAVALGRPRQDRRGARRARDDRAPSTPRVTRSKASSCSGWRRPASS